MTETRTLVTGWLEDLGISPREGGVTGPAVEWAISTSFGGSAHVSVALDARHPRRLEVLSDLAIAEAHRVVYGRLPKAERARIDQRIMEVLLRRSALSFRIHRDDAGVMTKIAMRAHLLVEGLTPTALVGAIHDARNATMDLCVAFQHEFGNAGGEPLDLAYTDPGYANVVLERGTLETLGAFQIPGETLDETILRAVRE